MRHGPEVVVHTAYVQQGDAMRETIVRGSRAVAAAADRSGARLVHLSTDLVFDGEQGAPYAGGGSAKAGDGLRRREARGRASRRAGAPGRAARADVAPPTARQAARRKRSPSARALEFYTDEIRCPTRVDDLAAALLELAQLGLSGVLHKWRRRTPSPATSSPACCAQPPGGNRTKSEAP